MQIKPFAVEEWMNEYETSAQYNIAETCVDSVSTDELFALCGEDRNAFLSAFCARRLTYGDIEGAPAFREGIAAAFGMELALFAETGVLGFLPLRFRGR